MKPAPAQSLIFAVLTFGQSALALALRSERRTLRRLGFASNRLTQHWMNTTPLSGLALFISVLAALVMFAVVEWSKRER